ncbi:MAG: 4-(cytidine 5'-diphospho)-2-C-methyl-D-erythritol kinase [Deltaproteobacteria bacterium]|nr:4-(cytidine 5'-diphospho)-2-C-methyl-D-erythritol kinase [Deltaproteobacteria bacterium]
MNSLLLSSPAKLNLYLDVLRRRPDGYHELETVFERISLADTLYVRRTRSGHRIRVTCSDPAVPGDRRNLAYQAADLLRRTYGVKDGLSIAIRKKIPVGAGLGGGSSNAAATLLACNELFGLKLSPATLIAHANEIGSDAAFFVSGLKWALGRGRGGDLTPLKGCGRLKYWHILVVPNVQVLTKGVYAALRRRRKGGRSRRGRGATFGLTKKGGGVNMVLPYLREKDIPSLDRALYNRLTQVVLNSNTFVSEVYNSLHACNIGRVHMSGSGPSLFVLMKDHRRAQRVFYAVRRQFRDRCRVFLASTG